MSLSHALTGLTVSSALTALSLTAFTVPSALAASRSAAGPSTLSTSPTYCLTALPSSPLPSSRRTAPSVPDTLVLARLTGPIDFDGVPDEPAWDAVEPLPLVVFAPVFRGEPGERTEIRIAYDDRYLYASCRCYTGDPSTIRGNSHYRDRYSGDDVFAVILDSFNDYENGMWFWTTPTGVRMDYLLSADGAGGFAAFNSAWNTFWDVAVTRTGEGWFAEMRIPFSSLRFQQRDGRVVMGLISYRWIAARAERQLFPAMPPSVPNAPFRPSQGVRVMLRGVEPHRPLYVTPYAVGGLDRTAELDPAGLRFTPADDATAEAGVDAKYPLTSNLALDLTVNTDFAQVEADDQQVNLTRFSLFFPEKRQFFQERSGLFAFELGESDRLFHSRRIGLDDEGQPVRILGGVRLVGRVGQWDLGALEMHTARSGALAPENFGALRARRQILNDNSYVGGMMTSRLREGGAYNVAAGADGVIRVAGDDYLTYAVAQTFDDSAGSGADASIGRITWDRRTAEGLIYAAALTRAGRDYRPEMGFQLRTGFTRPVVELGYGWVFGERTAFRSARPFVGADAFFRNADGTAESAEIAAGAAFEFKADDEIELSGRWLREDLLEPFVLSDADGVAVPQGTYEFLALTANWRMGSGRLFRTDGEITVGEFFDGTQVVLSVEPTWNVSPHLELGGAYVLSRIRFGGRGQRFDADIVRARVQAAANTRASAQAFVQYGTETGLAIGNVRLRYNFAEGNDLFLVYNEVVNADRDGLDPVPLRTKRRTLLLKYTYTFVF